MEDEVCRNQLVTQETLVTAVARVEIWKTLGNNLFPKRMILRVHLSFGLQDDKMEHFTSFYFDRLKENSQAPNYASTFL